MQMVCQCNPNRFTVKPKLLVDALLGKPSESFMMIGVRYQKKTRTIFGIIRVSSLNFPKEHETVKSWVLKTANKSFKDWKSDLNLDYVKKRAPTRPNCLASREAS